MKDILIIFMSACQCNLICTCFFYFFFSYVDFLLLFVSLWGGSCLVMITCIWVIFMWKVNNQALSASAVRKDEKTFDLSYVWGPKSQQVTLKQAETSTSASACLKNVRFDLEVGILVITCAYCYNWQPCLQSDPLKLPAPHVRSLYRLFPAGVENHLCSETSFPRCL